MAKKSKRSYAVHSAKERAKLLTAYQRARDDGMSAQDAADSVGVPYITLRCWERAGEGGEEGKASRPRGRPRLNLFKLVFPDGTVWSHEDLGELIKEAQKTLTAKK